MKKSVPFLEKNCPVFGTVVFPSREGDGAGGAASTALRGKAACASPVPLPGFASAGAAIAAWPPTTPCVASGPLRGTTGAVPRRIAARIPLILKKQFKRFLKIAAFF
jgi:hypothetical protein